MTGQRPGRKTRSVVAAATMALWVLAIWAPLRPAPAQAAAVKVQTGPQFNNANTRNLVVTLSAASTAGNLLIVQSSLGDTTGTFSGPANWVKAVAALQINNGRNEIWYYPNNPGGITTATFVNSGALGPLGGVMTEWSGMAATNPLDQIGSASNSGSASLAVPTAGATSAAGEVGVTMYTVGPAGTLIFTAGAGWTHIINDPPTTEAADYIITAASGVVSETETFNSSQNFALGIIATFKPAGSVPTVASVSPASGATAGGTSVQINGNGFTGTSGAAGVKFGATDATSYVVNTNILITAVSPAGAAGTVDITVTNGSTSTTSAADQFAYIGSLTLTAPATIAFPATTLVGTSNQTVTQTAAFTVVDTTSGVGWKLQAVGGLLTSAGHTLGAANVPSAPPWVCNGGCTLPTNAVGFPYVLPTGAPAIMYNAASGTGEQSMTGTVTFNVAVPANSYAGNYGAVWTFTLQSGP